MVKLKQSIKLKIDSNIKYQEPNDIESLLKNFPTIKLIVFNGSKAFKVFKKHIGCDILPPPTLRLEVGASRVIPSHDGKLTERSPCAPRFEDKLDDRQSFHALMFDIDGRIDVPVALESTFTAECPFRKR